MCRDSRQGCWRSCGCWARCSALDAGRFVQPSLQFHKGTGVIFHVFTDEEKCETLENSGQCDGCNRVLTAVAFQSRF